MKPVIFCLEDFEMHRFILEARLHQLVGSQAEIRFFKSLGQLKACPEPCDLLISDLNLGDSDADNTASFLREFCNHTPVLVQSAEISLPEKLENETLGRIQATEKAGHGNKFSAALTVFMAQFHNLSRNMK